MRMDFSVLGTLTSTVGVAASLIAAVASSIAAIAAWASARATRATVEAMLASTRTTVRPVLEPIFPERLINGAVTSNGLSLRGRRGARVQLFRLVNRGGGPARQVELKIFSLLSARVPFDGPPTPFLKEPIGPLAQVCMGRERVIVKWIAAGSQRERSIEVLPEDFEPIHLIGVGSERDVSVSRKFLEARIYKALSEWQVDSMPLISVIAFVSLVSSAEERQEFRVHASILLRDVAVRKNTIRFRLRIADGNELSARTDALFDYVQRSRTQTSKARGGMTSGLRSRFAAIAQRFGPVRRPHPDGRAR